MYHGALPRLPPTRVPGLPPWLPPRLPPDAATQAATEAAANQAAAKPAAAEAATHLEDLRAPLLQGGCPSDASSDSLTELTQRVERSKKYPKYLIGLIKKLGGTLASSQSCRLCCNEMNATAIQEEVKEGEEANTHTWYRVGVRGSLPIRNQDTSSWELCHGGTCFHACKGENGLKGIMNDGDVMGMPYREDDPMSGSGTRGFYGNAIHNMDVQDAPWRDSIEGAAYAQKRMKNILIWCMAHHCDTGVVVELRYRAEKKVVCSASSESETVKPGYCTRLKLIGGGERWCCWHEDCEIEELWVGPHIEQINAGASSSTQPDGDMPGWMQSMTKKMDHQEKPEKGKKRRAEKEKPQEEQHKEKQHKEAKRWYFNIYPCKL